MTGTPSSDDDKRRRRRPQHEIKQRIEEAARTLFTTRGYAATTTRDIALRADVSETLLFRHYGSKAALFDHIVFDPFEALATRFLGDETPSPAGDPEVIIEQFIGFLDTHRPLLTTLAVKGLEDTEDERAAARLSAMRRHYEDAAEWVRRECERRGIDAPVKPELAVRLTFGMVLASSLFSEWLFPDGAPSRSTIVKALDRMIAASLSLTPIPRD